VGKGELQQGLPQGASRRQWSPQKQHQPWEGSPRKQRQNRRWQQQQGEEAGEKESQGQQQPVWAPLPTLLDVLLVQPLQVQYKITTLVCWQQLVQHHQLLATCDQLHLFFFHKAGDWAQLLAEKLEEQLQVGTQLNIVIASARQQSQSPWGQASLLGVMALVCSMWTSSSFWRREKDFWQQGSPSGTSVLMV
jgi:hypothetical protein